MHVPLSAGGAGNALARVGSGPVGGQGRQMDAKHAQPLHASVGQLLISYWTRFGDTSRIDLQSRDMYQCMGTCWVVPV
jgi:hypothetical protein